MAHDPNLRGYDTVADAYGRRFAGELADKPFDRALLRAFADLVRGRGRVVDLGCGPGHVGAFLKSERLDVEGLDASAEMIRVARETFPEMTFTEGDFRALPYGDASIGGVSAAYAIVHLSVSELTPVFAEISRVLVPGGYALVSFHVGDAEVRVDELLGLAVSMTFRFLPVAAVREALTVAGLAVTAVMERQGEASVEHPSQRAYVFAKKPSSL